MTLLSTDIRESATRPAQDYSMRCWAGRMFAVMGTVLIALLITLLAQVETLTSSQSLPQYTMLFVLLGLAALLVTLAIIVIHRASVFWRQAKEGLIGTRLQSRIIVMFCMVAIEPTVTVSLFSALFFNYGIQAWFDARVSAALD